MDPTSRSVRCHPQAQARWSAPGIAEQMIREAIDNAGLENDQLVLA